MADWLIQEEQDGKVRSITEERLRKKLRRGKLSGEERVKAEGTAGAEWQPIHSFPLFREEIGPSDPASRRSRARQRFLSELGAWAFFTVAGFWWLKGWAAALFAAGAVAGALRYARDRKSVV